MKKAIAKTIDALLATNGAKTATCYMSEKMTIRATLRKGNRRKRGAPRVDVCLTIGAPNFRARKFIKLAKQAKISFPVRQIQLTFGK